MTASTPKSRGFCPKIVAHVLSVIVVTLNALATLVNEGRSCSSKVCEPGLSKYIKDVFFFIIFFKP